MELSFQEENLPDSEAVKTHNFFDFDISAEDKENNGKLGYSQADELLESTSFLARAKLSDETVSCNSTKVDITHMNKIMDKCSESIKAAENKTQKCFTNTYLETEQLSKKQNAENTKPISAQIPVIYITECNNSDMAMDISIECDEEQPNNRIVRDFSMDITDNELNIDTKSKSHNQMKIHLNEAIGNASINYYDNNGIEDANRNISHSNQARRTLYFNNKIPLEIDTTIAKGQKNNQTEIIDECLEKSNAARKTLYFNDEISLENEFLAEPEQRNQQTKITDGSIKKVNLARKTIYFNNEITEDNLPIRNEEELKTDLNTTIVLEKSNITFNEHENNKRQKNIACSNKERLNASSPKTTNTNQGDAIKTKLLSSNKTINTSEFVELSLQEECIEDTRAPDSLQMLDMSVDDSGVQPPKHLTKYENEQVSKNNIEILPPAASEDLDKNKRKTILYMENNNDMSLNQSFKPAEHFEFHEPQTFANVSKFTKSLPEKTLKLCNKPEMTLTPIRCTGGNATLFCMTPRLSLLEFTALEKKITEDYCMQSPNRLRVNKRQTVNLTPLCSIPKRQTLIFDDYQLKASPIPTSNLEKTNSPQDKDKQIELTNIEQEEQYIKKDTTDDDVMTLSGIVPNESILQTLRKDGKSLIPVHINSANKPNKVLSLTALNDNNPRQAGDDKLGESIQLMRSAAQSSAYRSETRNKQLELEGEIMPECKPPSIFEGNPITISDVSVYFEAQRKSNASNKTNDRTTDQAENPKKDLENRYLHITLEDIDKTRLSLVRLSCEDTSGGMLSPDFKRLDEGTGKPSPSKDFLENKSNLKPRRMDNSLLCRKCKRCQETLSNNTSVDDSFTLPELPPLPDLGLERLRRLRKRPRIADVNVLWRRLSLDHTVIDVSDDDIDLENAVEAENDLAKFLRVLDNDMTNLEMDLLKEKHMTPKEPFVLRLNALLRTHSPNWIFNYQMQYRGKLLFTHRKMFFALALIFEEVDPMGLEIDVKCIKVEKHHVPEKNWKPIDSILDFQLKLMLPLNLQWRCKSNSETDVLEKLQEIDRACDVTVKMGNSLQRITFGNQATFVKDELRTYVRKIVRTIENMPDSKFKYVKKTVIKVDLLNLETLSFKNIFYPPLHNFREEIHLLSTGLEFLKEFLPNPLKYLKEDH